MSKTSEIKVNIELDQNNVPEKLSWTAQDGGVNNEEAKTVLLSIWDAKAKETLYVSIYGQKTCLLMK